MTSFLLNPNFAYLILVVGFLFMIFAILTPGTGVFELSAVFLLVLAGWQIYNLQINIWALIVLILSLIPFIFAIWRNGKSIYLGVAILAFVVGSTFMFREGTSWFTPAVNPILAIFVSLVGGGFLWIITFKSIEARSIQAAHDLDSLIGGVGKVSSEIHVSGTVYSNGESWTAKSDSVIKVGSKVRILDREGFILTVEEIIEEG